jgi:hypothetical protein
MDDAERRQSNNGGGEEPQESPMPYSPTQYLPPPRSLPPVASPGVVLPPNLWNEVNRLTNANRQHIIDFISGKYIKSDSEYKKLILMHRIEVMYKDAPHFERYF